MMSQGQSAETSALAATERAFEQAAAVAQAFKHQFGERSLKYLGAKRDLDRAREDYVEQLRRSGANWREGR